MKWHQKDNKDDTEAKWFMMSSTLTKKQVDSEN